MIKLIKKLLRKVELVPDIHSKMNTTTGEREKQVRKVYTWGECFEELKAKTSPWLSWLSVPVLIVTSIVIMLK